jgi:hypothetical protein
VDEHVDAKAPASSAHAKIKEASPGIPRGVLEQLALARADNGSGCRCGVYRHLFVKKA